MFCDELAVNSNTKAMQTDAIKIFIWSHEVREPVARHTIAPVEGSYILQCSLGGTTYAGIVSFLPDTKKELGDTKKCSDPRPGLIISFSTWSKFWVAQ